MALALIVALLTRALGCGRLPRAHTDNTSVVIVTAGNPTIVVTIIVTVAVTITTTAAGYFDLC